LPYGKHCHIFGSKEIAMGTMNISLPDPMKSWVEDQTRSGRYANSSDYVRDLIRRDRARREAIAEVQAAVDAGLASGAAKPLDRQAFKERMRAQYAGK
jgi:antitoxin ParD1/3/4